MRRITALLCAFIFIFSVGCSKQNDTTTATTTTASPTETTVFFEETSTALVDATSEPESTSTESIEITSTEENTEPPYTGPSMESDSQWPELAETQIPALFFHNEEDGYYGTSCIWDIEQGVFQLGIDQFIHDSSKPFRIMSYDGDHRVALYSDPMTLLNESLDVLTYDDSVCFPATNLYNPTLREVIWIDASETEKHFELEIIRTPSEFGLRRILESGYRTDIFTAKDGDQFLMFFLWMNEDGTLDVYVLRYYPMEPYSSTWHEYVLPLEYGVDIYMNSSHDECKYIDGKFYMTSATHIVCLDLETGEVTTLDDAIGQVTAMYPEHSQFDPQGIPVPYEVEAQWGKYLIISMPMRSTEPSNPVNYSAWLAVDSSTHQVAGLFETEKTALPSGEFEYVVTCYDENLEPLGEPYTLPTPGGFFFATEPAK